MTPRHILTAGVVVLNLHGEILLVKHAQRGWELPGGHVNERESIRFAAIRRIRESTGVEIRLLRYCGIFQHVKAGNSYTLFVAKSIGGKIKPGSHFEDVAFFPIETAIRLIPLLNIKQRILYCLDESKQPFFVEF
ncbi:NUDIX hydrolase [Hazenella sp. IB182357]|uniref:NUDIX hydrolase n=1 Tax=Polycladospora coralii TaxID=2771432 RepID=A0A926RTB2_9BACL|nr:NUDIX hydrolase [Polycladospora coralii]MBD1370934.1 NUDIX hydrolase [Polycladospora coralii]MBS7529873.1 NUDIX hydrolase [Polycladospora coralii]